MAADRLRVIISGDGTWEGTEVKTDDGRALRVSDLSLHIGVNEITTGRMELMQVEQQDLAVEWCPVEELKAAERRIAELEVELTEARTELRQARKAAE